MDALRRRRRGLPSAAVWTACVCVLLCACEPQQQPTSPEPAAERTRQTIASRMFGWAPPGTDVLIVMPEPGRALPDMAETARRLLQPFPRVRDHVPSLPSDEVQEFLRFHGLRGDWPIGLCWNFPLAEEEDVRPGTAVMVLSGRANRTLRRIRREETEGGQTVLAGALDTDVAVHQLIAGHLLALSDSQDMIDGIRERLHGRIVLNIRMPGYPAPAREAATVVAKVSPETLRLAFGAAQGRLGLGSATLLRMLLNPLWADDDRINRTPHSEMKLALDEDAFHLRVTLPSGRATLRDLPRIEPEHFSAPVTFFLRVPLDEAARRLLSDALDHAATAMKDPDASRGFERLKELVDRELLVVLFEEEGFLLAFGVRDEEATADLLRTYLPPLPGAIPKVYGNVELSPAQVAQPLYYGVANGTAVITTLPDEARQVFGGQRRGRSPADSAEPTLALVRPAAASSFPKVVAVAAPEAVHFLEALGNSVDGVRLSLAAGDYFDELLLTLAFAPQDAPLADTTAPLADPQPSQPSQQ